MQTPKRKPGHYSHIKTDPNLTEAKYHSLKTLVTKLKADQKVASKEVARLAEFGDFSENHAYQMEKGRLRGINQRIIEAEDLLSRASIIQRTKGSNKVELGSKVTVEVNGRTSTYHILGSAETDPFKGIISHNSPIGAALLGHTVGDTVVLEQASSRLEYHIVHIE